MTKMEAMRRSSVYWTSDDSALGGGESILKMILEDDLQRTADRSPDFAMFDFQ
jgi:hypothetical protein